VVGVDERGDLRLVDMTFVKVRLRRLAKPPDADVFSWKTYAGPDAKVSETPLVPPSELKSSEKERPASATRRRE
jgi:hypothetical protein